MVAPLSQKIIDTIKNIPKGKVATYGQIAAKAGNPQAARQVVRILHIYSEKEHLPWFRVINSKGQISLKPGSGYELQKSLLEGEGVKFNDSDKVDFKKYGWV